MKENTNIDINTVKLLYKKYKEHLIYLTVIFVVIVLFFSAILPRVKDLSRLNNDRKTELEKLTILKKNLDLLSSLDDSSLDSSLLTVSSVLPSGKNFEGVLNAISNASEKSGISLSDYEFQIGDLSEPLVKTTGFPFLTLVLSIRGSPSQVIKFVSSLSKTAPISEVTSISQGASNASVSIVLYYKSLPPIELNDTQAVSPISQKEKEIISTLSSWDGVGRLSQPEIPVSSTSSASPF